MKRSRLLVGALAASLLAFTGCSKDEPADTSAVDDAAEDIPEVDVTVPTQDEADADAAAAITEESADDAFEALSKEIEEEGEGGG